MEVFLALIACACHELPRQREDVEAQNVACGAERDEELAQRRPAPELAEPGELIAAKPGLK